MLNRIRKDFPIITLYNRIHSKHNIFSYFKRILHIKMDLKLSCFLVVLVFCASLTIAQKKSTTITGDLTRNKDIGTKFELGISHQRGNWGVEGRGFATSRGHRGGNLGISHKHKNYKLKGTVFADNQGNQGATFGFGLNFRKRSAIWNGEHFEVRVIANSCDFNVYDINDDSVMTVDEIYELFPQRKDAHRLFKALDSTSVDSKVTIDEFKLMAPQVIRTCGYNM